jgi:8-oxo-dGTP diphosphatase
MVYIRRRGTAIVESASGILVVSKGGPVFTLPGGGARPDESDSEAAIRELKEETGLDATETVYLFEFLGQTNAGPRGGIFRNAHKVFLAKAKGVPKPNREIKKIAYYTGVQPPLTYSARRIIDRFQATRPEKPLGAAREGRGGRIGGLNTRTGPNFPDADAGAGGDGGRVLGAHRGTPQKDLRGTVARRRGTGKKAAGKRPLQ